MFCHLLFWSIFLHKNNINRPQKISFMITFQSGHILRVFSTYLCLYLSFIFSHSTAQVISGFTLHDSLLRCCSELLTYTLYITSLFLLTSLYISVGSRIPIPITYSMFLKNKADACLGILWRCKEYRNSSFFSSAKCVWVVFELIGNFLQ